MVNTRHRLIAACVFVWMANPGQEAQAQKGKGPPAKGPVGPALPKFPGKGGFGSGGANPLFPDEFLFAATEQAKLGPRSPDEIINMMRYTRLIHINMENPKNPEALLWDVATNDKYRVKRQQGNSTFRLVQTVDQQRVIYAAVLKFDKKELIYQVMLQHAERPQAPKWWRYPAKDMFYTLHPEDLKSLPKLFFKDKGNENDAFYFVPNEYWEKLTARGKGVIELKGQKTFQHKSEKIAGDVVWSDREAAILRCENPLPALAVASPSIAADRVYPERETIYPIQNGHLGDLIVASEDGKKPKRAEPLQKSDADHTFVMRRETWQSWGKYGIVSARGNSGTFEFYKGLIYGDIIAESDQLVVFRVAEKYCRIPDSENKPGQAERYHHGYCTLKLDDFVQDSLAQPLSEERVSEMFKKK